MPITGPFRNSVLRQLDREVVDRLELERIDLPLGMTLAMPDADVKDLTFVEEGVGSMTTAFGDGAEVEVCMFGYESVVGISALMGARRNLNRVFVQVAGHGYRASLAKARREFSQEGKFQRLALNYVQAQLTQSMQNAACNAVHNAEQRLARWLLTVRDRLNRSTFRFSHEFMAVMLGSTRATVTIAAGALKESGLIDYHRGMMDLIDVAGLERHACECYGVVVRYLHDIEQFDEGTVR